MFPLGVLLLVIFFLAIVALLKAEHKMDIGVRLRRSEALMDVTVRASSRGASDAIIVADGTEGPAVFPRFR
jgi:hypothetical protein